MKTKLKLNTQTKPSFLDGSFITNEKEIGVVYYCVEATDFGWKAINLSIGDGEEIDSCSSLNNLIEALKEENWRPLEKGEGFTITI